MKANVVTLLLVLVLIFACGDRYADVAPYLNPTLSTEERVDDLLSRMTLEQKISQMCNDAPAIDSLKIPAYNWWNECLHGVARSGRATVFPQAIGLAATWDRELMFRIAEAISDEARAKHHEYVRRGKRGIYQGLTFWSPNINLFRDPRWGRGMETYGEDPYLTGDLAVQFIRGLQGDDPDYLKTVATVKHYAVHSGPESERHTFDAQIHERDLRESYLPHFRAGIIRGRAYSVMCAYNRYWGEPCCGSPRLLGEILRGEWGFNGYVVSDCGAIRDFHAHHQVVETAAEAAALAVRSGTDLNCGHVYRHLQAASDSGLISEQEIDTAVGRLFSARFRLGMFDPPEKVCYSRIPYDVVDCDRHARLAEEAARKSIVLLKNDGPLLPLNPDTGTIAVIGPNADDVEVLLGNYNGVPTNPVTPLQGIREAVGTASRVEYALGCEWAENLPCFDVVPDSVLFTPDHAPGLVTEIFDNREFNGEPVLTRVDENIDVNWWDGAPAENLDDDDFAVRWSGVLMPPVTGNYALGGNGFSGFRIWLEDSLIVQFRSAHHPSTRYERVELVAGKPYRIKIEFFEDHGDARMKLLWSVPGVDRAAEAESVAARADVVVMVLGISPRLEGEQMDVEVEGFSGGDRLTLQLPAPQQALLKRIHGLNVPIVLVLLNGSALAVNWAEENVPAILELWYPGQAAGRAIADVLFGEYNPGGRLPLTFYRSVDQLPPFEAYEMDGRTYRYFSGQPLYPFGHGLSYTRFNYLNITHPDTIQTGQEIAISVELENAGGRDGDEVVQLYLTDVQASSPVAIRTLVGFERLHLKAGSKRTVTFTLNPRQLSLISSDLARVIEPGIFKIYAGGGQPGTAAPGIWSQFEVAGEILAIEQSNPKDRIESRRPD